MTKRISLDRGWEFRRCDGDNAWRSVDLPHCPFVPDINGAGHWFGDCEYRRTIQGEFAAASASRTALYVGAAMHTANVLIDGQLVGKHAGGYLPFEIDLTQILADGAAHELTIRLDNRANEDVPPGKPFDELDFCWYGGLYRDVELRVYPPVHITDPVAAGCTAGGGVFFRTESADTASANVAVLVHVFNASARPQTISVLATLLRDRPHAGRSESVTLPPQGGAQLRVDLRVTQPALWSPASPALYALDVSVLDASHQVLDAVSQRVGIRGIGFSRSGGFTLNGQKHRLRGTNRHQEYPYAGYALPKAVQYRDAVRIKEAGFDFVRLSHYPQSPDFLDACDELGLVVLNAIPGWQFMGGAEFRRNAYQNARDLIRRDRNHACVVLWELSLNETEMDEEFMRTMHTIGHEEYPVDQMFTAGWIDRFDVYLHSRQHGEIHRWKNGDKALVIGEYGDWEFYAANEGFDQKTGTGLHADWSHSRQFRGGGERALRQQVCNHVLALNDTLSSPAVLDGQWAVFDYARGYHPLRAAVGVMDVFRLPKFSYYFYRSQRGPAEGAENWQGGPMVFVASHWTATSELRVLVFSNCEEVELRLNGALIGREKPARTWMTQFLPHPPFVFQLPSYVPGELRATGFLRNAAAAVHSVKTPGAATSLHLEVEDGACTYASNTGFDLRFAHARLVDDDGTLCVQEKSVVKFALEGAVEFVGPAVVEAEAGIASVLLRVAAGSPRFSLTARAEHPKRVLSAVYRADAQVAAAPRRAVSAPTAV